MVWTKVHLSLAPRTRQHRVDPAASQCPVSQVLLTRRTTKTQMRVVSAAEELDHEPEPKSDPSAAEGDKF
jgi:hypothetical protein